MLRTSDRSSFFHSRHAQFQDVVIDDRAHYHLIAGTVTLDESGDLPFEIAWRVVIFGQDAVLSI
jgi:hypothetical protein